MPFSGISVDFIVTLLAKSDFVSNFEFPAI